MEEDDFENDFRESKEIIKGSNSICNLERPTNAMKSELRNPNFNTDARKQARDMFEFYLSHFKFTECMKEDARFNFMQLLNNRTFYFSASKTKIILAGVCVYLTMNKFDCAVTKNTISKSIGCNVRFFD